MVSIAVARDTRESRPECSFKAHPQLFGIVTDAKAVFDYEMCSCWGRVLIEEWGETTKCKYEGARKIA